MKLNTKYDGFRRWDIIKLSGGSRSLVVKVRKDDECFLITVVPYRKFKYKWIFKLNRLWLKFKYGF